MIVKRAEIIGKSLSAFRCGHRAFIIGVAMVTPDNLNERLCYHVIYDDGLTDYVPMSCVEDGSYAVVAERAQ